MSRTLAAVVLPEGLVLAAAAAVLAWPAMLGPAISLVSVVPPIVLVVGVALALRFGRSAVCCALLVLALGGVALVWSGGGASVDDPRSSVVGPVVAFLLPLNLLVLALLPEPGFTRDATARRGIGMLAQAALGIVLARPDMADVVAPLASRSLLGGVVGTGAAAGDPALLLAAGGVVTLTARQLRHPTPLTRGFLWALVAVTCAIAVPSTSATRELPAAATLLTVAAILLVVALVETAHTLAYRDGLTGLPSRRACDDALRRLPTTAAVAMVDVDHFKRCNDTYGHDVGDQVLRMVATRLSDVGAGGRAFRYGGEEFAVLFPRATASAVAPVLDALRESVADASFTVRAADRPKKRPKRTTRRGSTTRLSVTVSIGVADRTRREPRPDALVQAADDALYRAKRSGRNRVAVARPRER